MSDDITNTNDEEEIVYPDEDLPEYTGKQSPTPMTDACRKQFDEWDASIEEWRKGNKELAEKKLKELKECIKKWADSKKDELELEKEETEQSPVMKAYKALVEAIKAIKGDFSEAIKGIIKAFNAVVDFMKEVAAYISRKIVDLTSAITVIATRTPDTLANCAKPI